MLKPIFEDEQILAVFKPSGLPSQSHANEEQETAETVAKRIKPGLSLHLLHRLDTGTSGVLLFAKSKPSFDEIRLQFKEHAIRKFYRAWCGNSSHPGSSNPGPPHRIDLPLAHHPKSRKRMIALPPGLKRTFRGKPLPAITLLHDIRRITLPSGLAATECAIEIKTGVMHQIRVHLSHFGLPILGDPLYGRDLPPFPRLALHAERIEFQFKGYDYRIESKAPPFFFDLTEG